MNKVRLKYLTKEPLQYGINLLMLLIIKEVAKKDVFTYNRFE